MTRFDPHYAAYWKPHFRRIGPVWGVHFRGALIITGTTIAIAWQGYLLHCADQLGFNRWRWPP